MLDSFPGHKAANIKAYCIQESISTVYIPGGCTPYLQQLDIAVNKSIKVSLHCRWKDWIRARVSANPSGHFDRVDLYNLTQWLHEICRDIRPEIIKNGFRKALQCIG
jgi:hypothetical protein